MTASARAAWAKLTLDLRRRNRCQHDRVMCVHGDEIVALGYRRSVCLDCGKALKDLPPMCSVTGELHPSTAVEVNEAET